MRHASALNKILKLSITVECIEFRLTKCFFQQLKNEYLNFIFFLFAKKFHLKTFPKWHSITLFSLLEELWVYFIRHNCYYLKCCPPCTYLQQLYNNARLCASSACYTAVTYIHTYVHTTATRKNALDLSQNDNDVSNWRTILKHFECEFLWKFWVRYITMLNREGRDEGQLTYYT